MATKVRIEIAQDLRNKNEAVIVYETRSGKNGVAFSYPNSKEIAKTINEICGKEYLLLILSESGLSQKVAYRLYSKHGLEVRARTPDGLYNPSADNSSAKDILSKIEQAVQTAVSRGDTYRTESLCRLRNEQIRKNIATANQLRIKAGAIEYVAKTQKSNKKTRQAKVLKRDANRTLTSYLQVLKEHEKWAYSKIYSAAANEALAKYNSERRAA